MREFGGRAATWVDLATVWIAAREGAAPEPRAVERARAYRDRLVLKLAGIDDAGAAAALRGATVLAADGDAPPLPPGSHYRARLVGLAVRDEQGRGLGHVHDLERHGGGDLLVVQDGARQFLVPLAGEIVRHIDEAAGWIEVRLPPGLREL